MKLKWGSGGDGREVAEFENTVFMVEKFDSMEKPFALSCSNRFYKASIMGWHKTLDSAKHMASIINTRVPLYDLEWDNSDFRWKSRKDNVVFIVEPYLCMSPYITLSYGTGGIIIDYKEISWHVDYIDAKKTANRISIERLLSNDM